MSTASIVSVDLSGISSKGEMHRRFAATFSFPDYYGQNWDGFWDCVTTLSPMPREIRIKGMREFERALPEEAFHLRRCFEDFIAEPDLKDVTVSIE
jgi:RNAse (barnase) inhibitor barstar